MAQLHLARLRKDGGHEHREAGLHELRRLQIEVTERQPPSCPVQLQPDDEREREQADAEHGAGRGDALNTGAGEQRDADHHDQCDREEEKLLPREMEGIETDPLSRRRARGQRQGRTQEHEQQHRR